MNQIEARRRARAEAERLRAFDVRAFVAEQSQLHAEYMRDLASMRAGDAGVKAAFAAKWVQAPGTCMMVKRHS